MPAHPSWQRYEPWLRRCPRREASAGRAALREDPGCHLVPVSAGTTNLPSSHSPPRPSPRLQPPTTLLSSLSPDSFSPPLQSTPLSAHSVPKCSFSSSFFSSLFPAPVFIPTELLIVFSPSQGPALSHTWGGPATAAPSTLSLLTGLFY